MPIADMLVLAVIVLQAAFMALEIFHWPWLAQRVAGLPEEVAVLTKALGFNQGVYNGFLAAGLMYASYGPFSNEIAKFFQAFFLICVFVAGIAGAWSLKKPGFLIAQCLPAGGTLIAILMAAE